MDACPACRSFWDQCSELSCRELVAFLNDYLDGLLPPERRTLFERHLAVCPDCAIYLDSYRTSMELGVRALMRGDTLLQGPVPPDLIRSIRAALS